MGDKITTFVTPGLNKTQCWNQRSKYDPTESGFKLQAHHEKQKELKHFYDKWQRKHTPILQHHVSFAHTSISFAIYYMHDCSIHQKMSGSSQTSPYWTSYV